MGKTKGSATQSEVIERGASVDVRSPYGADMWFEGYFVLSVEGDRVRVSRHYLSEGQGGTASRLSSPVWKALDEVRLGKKISTRLCESVEWLLSTEERHWAQDWTIPRKIRNTWSVGDWVRYGEDVWWVREVDGEYLFLHRVSHPFTGSFHIQSQIYWIQEWVNVNNVWLDSANGFRDWARKFRAIGV